jgi:hypothetical protein
MAYDHLLEVLGKNEPEQEQQLRRNFTVDGALAKVPDLVKEGVRAELQATQARLDRLDNPSESVSREREVFHPAHLTQHTSKEEPADKFPDIGCVGIRLNDQGCVTAYDLVIESTRDPKNHVASYLAGEIESGATTVKTESRYMIGQTVARRFVISPPLSLSKFMQKTESASRLVQQKHAAPNAQSASEDSNIKILDQRMRQQIEAAVRDISGLRTQCVT